MSHRSCLRALSLGAGLALCLGLLSHAHAQTKLKFVLNWKYQGPQGIFFLPEDRGYYKAEGLDMTIDQGSGSGAAVPLVANGTYDVGFGDINALIELAGRNPQDAPIAVYVMYNQPPFTVAVKADSPIKSPKDFEGKTLGGAANDAALKLFPALCKFANIDCTKVKITNMQPNLREQMLMQGQVDGVFGYVNTNASLPSLWEWRKSSSVTSTLQITAWTSIRTASSCRKSWLRRIHKRCAGLCAPSTRA
jgi:NitT/TauT family transport system substrate-binding protein